MSQLEALLLTIVLEIAAAVPFALGLRWVERAQLARAAAVVGAVSLVSHPLAWQANTAWLVGMAFPVRAAIIELAVVALEGALMAAVMPLAWRRALVLAFIMNATSFGIGLALMAWGW